MFSLIWKLSHIVLPVVFTVISEAPPFGLAVIKKNKRKEIHIQLWMEKTLTILNVLLSLQGIIHAYKYVMSVTEQIKYNFIN